MFAVVVYLCLAIHLQGAICFNHRLKKFHISYEKLAARLSFFYLYNIFNQKKLISQYIYFWES
ncbi:hypothetical protein H206_02574 [Candidatus Electrothrix aarhusensis]|uniref:Uncharacterized protein n=1 Tax=Candidatus Electrothrix aarhusensis TaxID=1859131 RepID=A0A444ISD8_9BACT|nr:hypothetical protein H206_02574 [Candidatus Electrothrix aarhusensis]